MDISKIKNLSLASAVAMTLGIPLDSSAAGYLKLGDIKGESTAKEHKEWINILSWSWGMSEGDRGRTCVQDMSLAKNVDSATDDLAQSIPAGTVFADAQLVITATEGATSGEYDKVIYDMKNVKLTSLSSSGSDGRYDLSEQFSISFEELMGTYRTSSGDTRGQTFVIPANECK